ncbi:MAG: AzlC family ABC transporter permease [Clostridia bacterium]|nr:AzlC family ABC transporter permease [Clostridia bacterium]
MSRKRNYLRGMKAGIPIGLGYFAVALALGVAAKKAGLSPFQATLTSFLINASAGEYIGFTLIAAGASYLEVFLMEAIANARYMLMSAALSQKLKPGVGTVQRMLLGYCITDENFGVSIALDERLDPFYTYGVASVAIPGWSLGTLCGAMLGAVLPVSLLSALGVSLYGMFISVFIPESRKNKIVAGLVAISFALSYAVSAIPWFDGISDGVKIILLTVVISLAAALIFPVKEEKKDVA